MIKYRLKLYYILNKSRFVIIKHNQTNNMNNWTEYFMTFSHISLDLCSLIQVSVVHQTKRFCRRTWGASQCACWSNMWPPSSPDCGRVMKMVHFGHNKTTEPCYCPDQTFGVGGVRLDGLDPLGWGILQRFCASFLSFSLTECTLYMND